MHRLYSLAIAAVLTVGAIAAPPAAATPLAPAQEARLAVAMSPGYGLASPTWSLAAAAAEVAPSVLPGPDPRVAAGLTVGAPLGLGLLAIVIPALSNGGGMFLPLFVPLGFLAGYTYAGDPWRGVVATGAGILGLGVVYMAGVMLAFNYGTSWLSLPVMALGTAGFFGWMGYDAYKTAEQKSQPASPPPATP